MIRVEIAACPRCGEECPAWRVTNDGCALCVDELGEQIERDLEQRDALRAWSRRST